MDLYRAPATLTSRHACMDVKELQRIELFSRLSKKEPRCSWRSGRTRSRLTRATRARQGRRVRPRVLRDRRGSGRGDPQGGNRYSTRRAIPGAFFGEIGLLETERRTASVDRGRRRCGSSSCSQSQFKHMERGRCRPLPTASASPSARASGTHPRHRLRSKTRREGASGSLAKIGARHEIRTRDLLVPVVGASWHGVAWARSK